MGLTPEELKKLSPDEIRRRFPEWETEAEAEERHYQKLGEEIERHPIGHPRKRRDS